MPTIRRKIRHAEIASSVPEELGDESGKSQGAPHHIVAGWPGKVNQSPRRAALTAAAFVIQLIKTDV
jgi:hypothetical protein